MKLSRIHLLTQLLYATSPHLSRQRLQEPRFECCIIYGSTMDSVVLIIQVLLLCSLFKIIAIVVATAINSTTFATLTHRCQKTLIFLRTQEAQVPQALYFESVQGPPRIWPGLQRIIRSSPPTCIPLLHLSVYHVPFCS